MPYRPYTAPQIRLHRLHWTQTPSSSPTAMPLGPIYVEKGGFRKMPFYANFDIDGHKSIFSEVDPASRTQRAKVVLPLFSTGNLRSGSDVIYRCGCQDEEEPERETGECAHRGLSRTF